MWKIIKKQLEEVTVNKKKLSLWMKWEFVIEFASDNFWPYEYKFQREDCYFNDGLNDRGTKIFPLRSKKFDNTEIFLETDDIVIATGERWWLTWEWKKFIDIINIKTEKRYRVNSQEVNLIYNTKNTIVINFIDKSKWETLVLDFKSLEVKQHKKETLWTFFKCVYLLEEKQWFLLDFTPTNEIESDIEKKYKSGSFKLKKLKISWKPESFDREKYIVKTKKSDIDVWENSIK